MKIIPITLKAAKAFIELHHRHNKPPTGWKFGVGLIDDKQNLIGVGTAGRPIARNLDDGLTLEVNRTCTDGAKNANSMIYGALRRCAMSMGYLRIITYTQSAESGASLKASGFIKCKELNARKSWHESSKSSNVRRCENGTGGIARVLWEIKFNNHNDPKRNFHDTEY